MKDGVEKKLTRLETYYMMSNIKGILIFILVMYHFISGKINTGAAELQNLDTLSLVIGAPIIFVILCTVAAFVFFTGYGCKDTTACREGAFSLYLIPYLFLTVLMAVEMCILNGLPVRLMPFEPLLQLWYLLTLFWWMLLLKDLVRIKGIVVISCVLMLTVGVVVNSDIFVYSSGLNSLFGLSRMLYFLPALILGYKVTQESIIRLRNSSIIFGVSAIVLFIGLSMATVIAVREIDSMNMYSLLLLKGDAPYYQYLNKMDAWWKVNLAGTLLSLLFVLLSATLIYIMLRFIPKKKIPLLTRAGESSFTVFCLHGFITVPIAYILSSFDIKISLLLATVASVAVCLILSIPKINKIYSKFVFKLGDIIMKKQ